MHRRHATIRPDLDHWRAEPAANVTPPPWALAVARQRARRRARDRALTRAALVVGYLGILYAAGWAFASWVLS